MPVTVRVDRQGRVVIPQQERERLGLGEGGTLEMAATPEGLVLERRRRATVATGDDGLPLVTVDGLGEVANDDAVEAIHQQRNRT